MIPCPSGVHAAGKSSSLAASIGRGSPLSTDITKGGPDACSPKNHLPSGDTFSPGSVRMYGGGRPGICRGVPPSTSWTNAAIGSVPRCARNSTRLPSGNHPDVTYRKPDVVSVRRSPGPIGTRNNDGFPYVTPTAHFPSGDICAAPPGPRLIALGASMRRSPTPYSVPAPSSKRVINTTRPSALRLLRLDQANQEMSRSCAPSAPTHFTSL